MRRIAAAVLAAFHLFNGAVMIADPEAWYARIPGVELTGPFNPHFVLDVGIAFLAAGGAFAAFAIKPKLWPALLPASGFLAMHAILHLWGLVGGGTENMGFELALVVLPAAIAVAVAWPTKRVRGG